MRNILLVLIAAFVLASCSKKHDADPQPASHIIIASDLVGKWNVKADTTLQVTDGKAQIISTQQASDLEVNGETAFLQFNSDGTLLSGYASNVNHFTYTLSNRTIAAKFINKDGSIGDDYPLTILAITKSTLLIREPGVSDNQYLDIYLTK